MRKVPRLSPACFSSWKPLLSSRLRLMRSLTARGWGRGQGTVGPGVCAGPLARSLASLLWPTAVSMVCAVLKLTRPDEVRAAGQPADPLSQPGLDRCPQECCMWQWAPDSCPRAFSAGAQGMLGTEALPGRSPTGSDGGRLPACPVAGLWVSTGRSAFQA